MKFYLSFLFYLFFFIGNSVGTQPQDPKTADQLNLIHWMIERSEIDKVKIDFGKMCDKFNLTSNLSGLKDGIYHGVSPADDYGYRHDVKFEMKNGKLISIDYDEIHLNGHGKQNDKKYCEEMMQSGTSPEIAYPKYESGMVTKQDFNQVDAVSGASYSLYRFRLAILYAKYNSTSP